MNYESGTLTPATGDAGGDDWDATIDTARARKRRWIIIAAAVAAVLVLLFAWMQFSGGGAAQTEAASGGATGDDSIPSVTVMVPGRTNVERIISATGNLAARREMPVGVAGEGGQVVRVLVEPGQWVAAGQVLATIDRQVQAGEAESLSAQIRVAEANARLAQAELDRATALSARGFVSTADLERKTATRDAAAAQVRVARAQFGQSRARIGRLDIRAPAAGLVLTRQVEPGQVVSAGSGVLFRMARGGEMELLANVTEGDLAQLSVGERVSVTPVGGTQSYTGQIWQLSPVINPETRQGVARVALSFASGIRPGGFAEARIVTGSAVAPLLPESAVLNDEQGSYVYVIDRENKAQRVAVTIGQVSSAGVSILSGLAGQEHVVVSAGAFLNPGDRVRQVIARRPS